MFRTLALSSFLAGSFVAAAYATEVPVANTGPLLLDQERLDQVAAGNLISGAFQQAHDTLANKTFLLPGPAPNVIIFLHRFFLPRDGSPGV
ncbi:MAG: hypothetical protein RMK73_13880 [Geminicoccaceae bacterium]|nr:hypothetical protein [Geminicoccaceae bacterium]MDW8342567.1 hypothetical protein [Geminicoccaceae bacterium]